MISQQFIILIVLNSLLFQFNVFVVWKAVTIFGGISRATLSTFGFMS